MSNELSNTAHDYTFDEMCRVDPDTLLDVTRESLDQTNRAFEADPAAYFERTYEAVQPGTDVPYAHFVEADDSKQDVVVVLNPFGTRIAPPHTAEQMTRYAAGDPTVDQKAVNPNDANKLLQAKFFYDTMRHAGVRDTQGNTMPLIVVSAPSLDHHSTLNRAERRQVAHGDFEPFARRALDIVHQHGYNRIHAAGYSLGTIAASVVERAGREGLDVLSGNYVGDAPHFRNRRPRQPLPLGILPPYMLDSLGTGYKGNWAAANGLEPRKSGSERGESYSLANWFGNGNALVNLAIAKGLSVDGFSHTLEYMKTHRIPTTVSWSESKLMRGFESYINEQPDASQLATSGLLKLFCARKAPHISGENPVFLADVMTRSMLFAMEANNS